MGPMVEADEPSQGSEVRSHAGVTCIFCGLPTPVRAVALKPHATDLSTPVRHVSIVRCEVCGKEAPYLSHEVSEFGEVFQSRRAAAFTFTDVNELI